MSNQEFSHKLLSMILRKRDKGNVNRYLDKVNQYVIVNEISEEKKAEIIASIKSFFEKEDELFASFSTEIDNLLKSEV